jgi:conjugative transfer region lipoprotein (TIGR03751 family)
VNKIQSVIMLFTVCLMSACATKMSDVTADNALTMKEIYNGSFNEATTTAVKGDADTVGAINRSLADGDIDLRGYTRTANNEHNVLFKRLKNPILVGYVFAHLTKDNIPIPSYSVPFRMSPNDYYAMPGEDQSF